MEDKWKPKKIIDVAQQLPKFNLLKNAIKKLYDNDLISFPREVLTDQIGTWGYRFGHFILVAKEEPYGNLLSCHYSAILKCEDHEIPLLMWLEKSKKFYVFYADEIMKTNEGFNHKGKAKMINFNIKLGHRIIITRGSMKRRDR